MSATPSSLCGPAVLHTCTALSVFENWPGRAVQARAGDEVASQSRACRLRRPFSPTLSRQGCCTVGSPVY